MSYLHKMKISTEGVLVLASAKRLAKEYAEKEFDYHFPDGLSALLQQHSIIALTTMMGDSLIIDFVDEFDPTATVDNEIQQWIELEEDDLLLVLHHGEFTWICDAKGDYTQVHWSPVQKIANLSAGNYLVTIKIQDLSDQIDDFEAYFRLTVQLKKSEEVAPTENEVMDIMDLIIDFDSE